MSPGARSVLGLTAFLAALAASPPASAAPGPISGTLNQPGYTVIALAADGGASTTAAQDGSFALLPSAEAVTLHLRAPDGTYAGPIVLEEKGSQVKRAKAELKKAKRKVKRAEGKKELSEARKLVKKARSQLREAEEQEDDDWAILGVRAGASLGEVRVDFTAGYALARGLDGRAWERSVDTVNRAQASGGVPIGTGNFGRVRSGLADGAALGDLDRDGIPDALDIDDDGDLILDSLERPTTARTAQPGQQNDHGVRRDRIGARQGIPAPEIFSELYLQVDQTANANALAAAGLTPEQVDERIAAAVSSGGQVVFSGFSSSTEFDCGGSRNLTPPPPWNGGLPYCTLGGTGATVSGGEFPECCDSDNDGFGTAPSAFPDVSRSRVGTDQIKTGDQVIAHFPTSGDERQCPDASNPTCGRSLHLLPYVFATVPALVSYHDTGGNSATLSYPNPGGQFPVAAGPDGQVRLTLTLWRPQRRPIGDGENKEACLSDTPPCRWVDIGGLTYTVGHEPFGPCAQDAYSEDDPTTPAVVEDDPNLTLPTGPRVGLLGGLGFTDSRDPPDQPANPNAMLTFTVNLTQCTGSSPPWNPGDVRRIRLFAVPTKGGGITQQLVEFKHE